MGAAVSSHTVKQLPATYFLIERIIAADCDFLETNKKKNIYVGIHKNPDPENPIGFQGIRIGDSKISSLKSFTKTGNSVVYEFDNSIHLNIFRCEDDQVCYNLRTTDINVTREVIPIIAKNYREISMSSKELDAMKDILQQTSDLRKCWQAIP